MPITTTKTRQVADSNITYAKVQDISAANIILGRYTSGAGVAQELLIGAGLSISGSSLIANISGTTGKLAKFTGANTLGDSIVSESGGVITITGTTNTQPLLATDGTQGFRIGAYAGGIGYGAIYVQSVTPDGSNFTLAGIDTRTILNAPLSGTTEIAINASTKLRLSATELITFGATDTGEAHIFGGSARVNGALVVRGSGNTIIDSVNTFGLSVGAASATPNFVAIGTSGSGVPQINGYNNAFSATAPLALQPNGSNVLIGTTTDDGVNKLQVSGSLVVKQNTSNLDGEIFLGQNTLYRGRIFYDGSINGQFIFDNRYDTTSATGGFLFRTRTNGTPVNALQIAGDGAATFSSSVGVGVNPTNAKLEVVATTGEVFRADAAGGAYRIVADQSGVNLQGGINMTIGSNMIIRSKQLSLSNFSNSGVGMAFTRITSDSELMAIGVTDTEKFGIFSREGIIFATGGGSLYTQTTEAMRITSGGNVGIGTTSPAYKLDVNGDINSGGTLYTNVFNFRSNDVKTNAATVGRFSTLTGGSSDFELTFTRSAIGAGAYYAIQSVEQNVGFRDLVLQLNGGSVGIGTTTPSTKLHINFAGQGLLVSNDSGNRRLYMGTDSSGEPSIQATLSNGTVRQLNLNSDGGNVLIGTTTDAGYKLDVNGTARVSGVATFFSGAGSPVIIRKNASFTGSHYILFQNVGESQIAYMGYGSGGNDNFQVANSIGETQLYGGTSLFKLGYNGAESTINTTLRLTAGNTLSISQGDLYIQTGGYGILSPDANRLIAIQNGAATINGALTVSGLLELNLANSGTNAYHTLNRDAITTENMFKWVTNGVNKWWLGQRSKNSEDGFSLYSGAVSDDVLYFNPAGNATFYKGVTAGGNILINAENTYMAIDATANPRLGFVKKSGFQPFLAFATDPFTIRVSSASNVEATNTFTTLFTIETSGAATFSSSVTTGGSITIGTGGTYAAGSIYSDANWGMIFRAKAASPTNATFLWTDSADNELMRIKDGKLGIGIASPKQTLDINGNMAVTHANATTGYSEVIFYENSTVQADIFVNGTSNSNYAGASSMNIWQGQNAPIAFYTNGTNERMRITGAGNVGIGNNNPSYKLDVTGVIRATSDVRVEGKVYIGTNGAYIEEVLVGSTYELRVVDSAGNTTVL